MQPPTGRVIVATHGCATSRSLPRWVTFGRREGQHAVRPLRAGLPEFPRTPMPDGIRPLHRSVNLAAAAPVMQKDLGLSNIALGIAFSAFNYSYAPFQLVGGWFADRFGARRTLTVCGLAWSITTMQPGRCGDSHRCLPCVCCSAWGRERPCRLPIGRCQIGPHSRRAERLSALPIPLGVSALAWPRRS